MLLAVDIGNTSIKFGVFDGEDLKLRRSIPTNSNDIADALAHMDDISSAIICSVVPARTGDVVDAVSEGFDVPARVITNTDDLGLAIKHQPIESIGTDRVVSAFAAAELYGSPVIVCSLGTATTIDAVSENRELVGGLIAPGMRTAARALHLATARLAEVEPGTASSVINSSTETAIRAGLYYSQVGLLEATVPRMKVEIGSSARVVATGGFSRMIAEHCDEIDVVDDDLVLAGLQMLSSR